MSNQMIVERVKISEIKPGEQIWDGGKERWWVIYHDEEGWDSDEYVWRLVANIEKAVNYIDDFELELNDE